MQVPLFRWPSVGRPVRCLDHFGDITLEADTPLGLGADGFPVRGRVPFGNRREREELRKGQRLIVRRDVRAVLLLREVVVLRRMSAECGRRDTGCAEPQPGNEEGDGSCPGHLCHSVDRLLRAWAASSTGALSTRT